MVATISTDGCSAWLELVHEGIRRGSGLERIHPGASQVDRNYNNRLNRWAYRMGIDRRLRPASPGL